MEGGVLRNGGGSSGGLLVTTARGSDGNADGREDGANGTGGQLCPGGLGRAVVLLKGGDEPIGAQDGRGGVHVGMEVRWQMALVVVATAGTLACWRDAGVGLL